MSCEKIRGRIDDYVERELAGPERVAVAVHLATCDECRKRANVSEQIAGILYQFPREPAPEYLAVRIVSLIEGQFRATQIWLLRTIFTAAGSLIAGVIAVWLAFETGLAIQEDGIIDFISLLTSQPEMLMAYPQEALYAVLETLPATELVLTLGVILITLVLLGQLLTSLSDRRLVSRSGNGVV